MVRIVVALIVFLAGVALRAQERPATVVMDDGRVLAGTVVAIDLGALHLRVDDEVLTLATEKIQSCKFDGGEAPATSGSSTPPTAPTSTPTSAAAPVPPRRTGPPRPLPVVPGDEASVPHDLRYRTRLGARLDAVDAAFPWLVPTEPTQWISLSLLLFAFLSLVVHASVTVVGAETPAFGRSMAIAAWYGLTGFLQMALVPTAHVATFSMLIGNTAMALFWLRSLFGVTRSSAMIAFAVQLGFAVLGYGVLQMVTSLLGSIDPVPA